MMCPHYGTVEIEADSNVDAVERAKDYNYSDIDVERDPSWSAVCNESSISKMRLAT